MVIAWGGQKLPESVVNMEYAILIAFKDGNCRNSILTQKRQLLGRGTTWSYKYTPWGDIINTSQYITIHQRSDSILEHKIEEPRTKNVTTRRSRHSFFLYSSILVQLLDASGFVL